MPTYPRSIPYQDLIKTHPDYNAKELEDYYALYVGSSEFRDRIDNFLIKRKVEESNLGIITNELYAQRKKWAFYINRAGGLIDWLSAAVFPNNIEIRSSDEFYTSLNEDADGLGTPLNSILRKVLTETMVNKRAYLYPKAMGEDMRIWSYGALTVDNWNKDKDNILQWVRMHTNNVERYMDGTSEKTDKYIFIDNENIITYECKGAEKDATKVGEEKHNFGILPVFEIDINAGAWVMDRIYDVAVALFNAEAGLSFSTALSAHPQLVLKLKDSKIDSLVLSEIAAIRLDIDEDIKYLAPDANSYTPQGDMINRLKAAFYEVLKSMTHAENVPQAGRLSGDAIEKMQSPMKILLKSLAWPVVISLQNWITAVSEFRNDNAEVEVFIKDNEPPAVEDMKEAARLNDTPEVPPNEEQMDK